MGIKVYSSQFREFLHEAQAQILSSNIEGYVVNTYESSFSLRRSVNGVQEELTVRSIGNAQLKVEHCKIKKTPLGQKVKSNHIEGDVEKCVTFVKSLMDSHRQALASPT